MRIATLALPLFALAWSASPAAALDFETDDQKTIYTLGAAVADQLRGFDLDENEIRYLVAGISDELADRPPQVDLEAYRARLDAFSRQRQERRAQAERQASESFLAKAAAEPGATTTDSGLVFREMEAGSGATPSASDVVSVHYEGTLRDGTVFDSSKARGTPARFRVQGVIPCWTEALQRMKVGGKAIVTCPADIAYGDRSPTPKIPPGAALRFEVELLGIEPPPGG